MHFNTNLARTLDSEFEPSLRVSTPNPIRFVDEQDRSHYAGRHSIATIARALACLERRRPEDVPELELTLEQELKRQRVLALQRSRGISRQPIAFPVIAQTARDAAILGDVPHLRDHLGGQRRLDAKIRALSASAPPTGNDSNDERPERQT